MKNSKELYDFMTAPSPRLISSLEGFNEDLMIIGAGGKVGPSLCLKAKRAFEKIGCKKNIYAVSVAFDSESRLQLEAAGIIVIVGDIADSDFLAKLPQVKHIIYMVGRKFGTTGDSALTFFINAILPAKVCERFPNSSFVVFSTGNVYGLAPISTGGFSEDDQLSSIGEYAQSCLARERVFEYYSAKNNCPVLLFRLNYAIDMRYGVLHDIAKAVYEGRSIDLSQGVFNCIWQGDVCEYALMSLFHTQSPVAKLNVTGPESISIRWAAEEFGKRFNKTPILIGQESSSAIFSKTAKLNKLMGYPQVSLGEMLDMTAQWIENSGECIDAPTHFETLDGKY
ncbi:MAG: NAD-dependent epimerase/dehydratase family protein [Oscillospiraceae bacterium]